MPQDFVQKSDGTATNPQEIAELQKQAKLRGEVLPYEKQTVYATQKTVDMKSVPEISKVGHAMEVHPALAEKLIAQGKATKEQPKAAAKEEAKTEKEVLKLIEDAKTSLEVNALIDADSSAKVKEAAQKKIVSLGN